ncbi:hypothetical protein V1514DRAFT_326502 [Lipomyces japonicus]|uniref:uncharacterized protein n=1 Tax=Lipomyces japonicus TaxID=56871 RepID=UPI0034CD5817
MPISTPVRSSRFVIHRDFDEADHNKENLPPFSSSSSSSSSSHQHATRPLQSSSNLHQPGFQKLNYLRHQQQQQSVPKRAPLREIYLSSPATPENAYLEYFIDNTSLVESPLQDSPLTSHATHAAAQQRTRQPRLQQPRSFQSSSAMTQRDPNRLKSSIMAGSKNLPALQNSSWGSALAGSNTTSSSSSSSSSKLNKKSSSSSRSSSASSKPFVLLR